MANHTDPSRVRISGPLAPYVQGFAAWLTAAGYEPSSMIRHVCSMAHVSGWLSDVGLDASALHPVTIEAFGRSIWSIRRSKRMTAGCLEPLLGYLREVGALSPKPPPVADGLVDSLLTDYGAFLARERGLAAATIERNAGLVRPFLDARVNDGRVEVQTLTASDVIAFVVALSGDRPAVVPRTASALRSLLGFLHIQGLTAAGLAEAVPATAAWKLAGLPKALTESQVAGLLASCDQGAAVGRRNFAILTLLSRLGLRCGELSALRLEDVDWRLGEITVRGKGNRYERLPLPVDVGTAIVAYLSDGRPAAACREVFCFARGPHRPMCHNTVSNVVAKAARDSGLGTVHAHRLRHSVATGILRSGGSLPEVGQVLRHRDLLTTAIYAKTDIVGLRTLARPWPVNS